jgi:secondary thiamine-phosphate synthase enzyme
MLQRCEIATAGQGLYEITDLVHREIAESGRKEGLCTLFSLTIQENADPSAQRDLENWLNRLVPENDPAFTHTAEGPDDMPSHIKAALTGTSLAIPISDGRLCLGTWQGIFLWEHRRRPKHRQILVHIGA